MPKLFSNNFDIPQEMIIKCGVFDVFMDVDSHFFINLKRLQHCDVPEFLHSYDKINERFKEIALLLKNSTPDSKLYKAALKKFDFSEVNGINLGFSSGKHGLGFGKQLREQIIKDAYEIIKKGSNQPEIFHLVSLFEENVGPDRLSDMIARIIYDDIVAYSKRIYAELNINENKYKDYKFKDNILINPYKGCYLLLLPKTILSELPIAKCWDDIDRVCKENKAIRDEINSTIAENWKGLSISTRKSILKQELFMNPEKVKRIVAAYNNEVVAEVNLWQDIDYTTNYLIDTYKLPDDYSRNSKEASIEILRHFKKWIEFQRGNTIVNGYSEQPSEKLIQKLFSGIAGIYCEKFNWTFSPETDDGRGPVDFKISRGQDITVIEVKLTSNSQCVHGLEVQIEEYAKAAGTENKLFVLINVGKNENRIKQVNDKYNEMISRGLNPAEIVVIDAKIKKSASKF